MRLSICHTTRYEYDQPVARGLQRLRLKPKSTHGQTVVDWTMDLEGARHEVEYEDEHHNRTTLVTVESGTQVVMMTCNGVIDTADNNGILGRHIGAMPLWAFLAQTPLTKPGPRIRSIVSGLDADKTKPLEMLHALSRDVLAGVTYEIGFTGTATTAEEAVIAGHGVCQDHAQIFCSAARLLGIPARYVSGYLMMDDRIEQEAGHAWAEAHVEELGWVGFDVSNGISPDARYVRVATGRDYREAAPVTGLSYGPGESTLAVTLAVEQQTAEQ